jgi:hypothetical protein
MASSSAASTADEDDLASSITAAFAQEEEEEEKKEPPPKNVNDSEDLLSDLPVEPDKTHLLCFSQAPFRQHWSHFLRFADNLSFHSPLRQRLTSIPREHSTKRSYFLQPLLLLPAVYPTTVQSASLATKFDAVAKAQGVVDATRLCPIGITVTLRPIDPAIFTKVGIESRSSQDTVSLWSKCFRGYTNFAPTLSERSVSG